MISLAAIRWLADQKAAFLMLDRDGTILIATGPTGPRDARLRRAQALAHISGHALSLTRELIDRKLAAQERNVRNLFDDEGAAIAIAESRERLRYAATIGAVRHLEAQAALAYWGCWRSLQATFPKPDLPRVPQHWQSFGARVSPLTSSPRLSVNPANAMLNYLYAVLESEARLAAVALGLDPGLGVMHADVDARDSLAADLMEAIRPDVDHYVLSWLRGQTLRREWFFEERNGCCRLMGSFVERLSASAPTWAQAIAPIAERVSQVLWSAVTTAKRGSGPATSLTQRNRREAKGGAAAPVERAPQPPRVCGGCGIPVRNTYCPRCGVIASTERMVRVAEQGRRAALAPEAQARMAATRRRHAEAERAWRVTDQPAWLTESVFVAKIQPRLRALSTSDVVSTLGVSRSYANDIRLARCRPHPRHWLALANLAAVGSSTD